MKSYLCMYVVCRGSKLNKGLDNIGDTTGSYRLEVNYTSI